MQSQTTVRRVKNSRNAPVNVPTQEVDLSSERNQKRTASCQRKPFATTTVAANNKRTSEDATCRPNVIRGRKGSAICIHPGSKDDAKEPIINALITEYQNVHERVFRQISQYDDTNVKILMLIGVLLFFGLTNYDVENSYLSRFVDAVFFGALPLIAICSVLLSLADLVKVMILGDYLKIIENKIDRVLSDQADYFEFPRKRVLDWEYWRMNYGHVKGAASLSEISFSVIIVSLTVFISVFAAVIRLLHIHSTYGSGCRYQVCLYLSIAFIALFVVTLVISVIILKRRRSVTKVNARNDELVYPESKEERHGHGRKRKQRK